MNPHFVQYTRWKTSTLSLITLACIILGAIQLSLYWQLGEVQKRISLTPSAPLQEQPIDLQVINTQQPFEIFNALVEVMPPSVKLERFEYQPTQTTVACHALHHNAMVHMLNACAHNTVLKEYMLKKSSQEKDELLFILG